MNTMIIVVDRGHFKAYGISESTPGKSKMQLVESYDSIEAHGKLLDKITDQAGRFQLSASKGGVVKAKGYGEPHNIELEKEKRLIRLIAQNITALLEREKPGKWYFAASEELNTSILDHLSAAIKARLKKNVGADLTGSSKTALLRRFNIK